MGISTPSLKLTRGGGEPQGSEALNKAWVRAREFK
jgi:hypothetical protein